MSAKTHTIKTKNGAAIELSVLEGTVISAGSHTKWTTHHESATVVGKTVVPGQVYNVAHNVQDIWLNLPDGKEQKMPFASALVDSREGHGLVLLHARDRQGKSRCIAGWNRTTGEIRKSADAAAYLYYGVDAKRPKSWFGFWAMFAIGMFLTLLYTLSSRSSVVALEWISGGLLSLLGSSVLSALYTSFVMKEQGASAAAEAMALLQRLKSTEEAAPA